ncbi:hypothetical protein MRB53_015321 [Persea americana]|uniref:Uncharacterized protein n=1 Tax=Persea americana TaxID=3435 RepID=A0ACC2KDV2_PERAE|nr:hypothetical protein MRB53_015321 [Persea americana]
MIVGFNVEAFIFVLSSSQGFKTSAVGAGSPFVIKLAKLVALSSQTPSLQTISSSSSSSGIDPVAPNDIVHDFRPFFVITKDQQVISRGEDDHVLPVSSKDVKIVSDTGVSARLYIPTAAISGSIQKLPILIYYHGGGFCFGTPFCGLYDRYVHSLVSKAIVIVISVDYRRPPKDPLPAAYEDSWTVLQWVASQSSSGTETWLSNHGDFDNITIAGDSAGGNIVHNMAMRIGKEELGSGVTCLEILLPDYRRLDDPLVNPFVAGAPSLSGLGATRVLVCVAGEDILGVRGQLYYEELKSSGWKGTAELLVSAGENHVFHLYDPTLITSRILNHKIVSFINAD